MQVEAINRSRRIAVLENGDRLYIQAFLDDCGEETGADDAVVAVCGPDDENRWYTVDLRHYQSAFLN